ncbi:kyphoscoliosis peptidase [Plakobranchus ocellatus]|uniref:Kyphoscoliosis peptidase n=1 Tax=Plakobranchus ocellatus TaxID=259542 RepID=A0AAV4AR00_9GAST|nr:kyphoscoliosis peptidase [Plakobranchus ocellatus]
MVYRSGMSVKSEDKRSERTASSASLKFGMSGKSGKSGKYDIDNEEPKSPKVAIVETYGDDNSYKYAFTYEKATLYEFKYTKAPHPADIDPCYRCNRRVLKADQVNVGVLFHKQCFRCRICGIPLTIQNFQRNDANSGDREIYCRTHVGKKVSQIRSGEVQPMGIEGPSVGPGKRYVLQVSGSSQRPLPISANQKQLPPVNTRFSNTGGQNRGLNDTNPEYLNDTSQWTDESQSSIDMSQKHKRPVHLGQEYKMYSPKPIKPGPHPTSVLKSFTDFDYAGVFDAQILLEQRHKEEEERLMRFLLEEREKELSRLDDMVDKEKDKAAEDLLASIENLSVHSIPRNLVDERDRIEEHFKQVKEERLKTVTEKIGSEEKTRSSKMIERHCVEMLTLIGEKDREVDRMCVFDHSMRPPVEPPDGKKSSLYKSPEMFEHLDAHAMQLANEEFDTMTELVRRLTQKCETELEKARVLFRWVIAKDINKHSVNNIVRPNATDRLLKGVKSGKETYHQLYKKLCSYAGLHCEIVLGFSKGAGYKPGMRMEGQTFRNSWTAVNINGSWRLVNCTWAARHVTGLKDKLPPIYHKYDEFYFLTDPEDHIYQHYPDDPEWQLLDIPLPFSEFLALPVVKSPFFNYGLRFYSNYGATLTTTTGMVEIRLLVPKILGFGSMLEPVYRAASEPRQIEGRTLLRLVNNEAIFTVALPQPGLFYFSIYVGDYWRSECLESAASFLINCPEMPGATSPPYPPVPFFGPTPVMEALKIQTDTHADPLVVCNSDIIEISFSLSHEDTRLTHTFQYFDVRDGSISDIDRYAFLRSRSDTAANYVIRCPKEGFFIFSLYAADVGDTDKKSINKSGASLPESKENSSTSLDCAFRYLIICQEPSPSVAMFPKTYQRWQQCALHEPLAGDLYIGKLIMFRLDVPVASEVFIVIGQIWHHLKRKERGTWEGQVHTGYQIGSATVYARFPGPEKETSLFSQILEYQIVEEAETEI